MTTFTHQLLSRKTSTPEVWQCECQYSSRSAAVSVAMLRMGHAEVVFIQPGGNRHQETWCLAKTSYPSSSWDVAVTNGQCNRTVLPLTPPKTQKLAAWESSVHWATFCPPNSQDLNTVNLPSGVLFSMTSKFLPSWQYEESNCQKHDRNYRMSQSLPIHQFYHLFICNYCYLPDGSTIFQGWFK